MLSIISIIVVYVSLFVAIVCNKAAIFAAVATTAASINAMHACDLFASVVMALAIAGGGALFTGFIIQWIEKKFNYAAAAEATFVIVTNACSVGVLTIFFGMMMLAKRNGGFENAIPAAVVSGTALVITLAIAGGMDNYYARCRSNYSISIAEVFGFAALLLPISVIATIVYAIAATYVGLWSKVGVIGVVWYTEFFILSWAAIDAAQTNFWTQR